MQFGKILVTVMGFAQDFGPPIAPVCFAEQILTDIWAV